MDLADRSLRWFFVFFVFVCVCVCFLLFCFCFLFFSRVCFVLVQARSNAGERTAARTRVYKNRIVARQYSVYYSHVARVSLVRLVWLVVGDVLLHDRLDGVPSCCAHVLWGEMRRLILSGGCVRVLARYTSEIWSSGVIFVSYDFSFCHVIFAIWMWLQQTTLAPSPVTSPVLRINASSIFLTLLTSSLGMFYVGVCMVPCVLHIRKLP